MKRRLACVPAEQKYVQVSVSHVSSARCFASKKGRGGGGGVGCFRGKSLTWNEGKGANGEGAGVQGRLISAAGLGSLYGSC